MTYVHGLILYNHPRKCIYNADINKYDLQKGWLTEETEITVIGHDDYNYVTKVFNTNEYIEHPNKPPLKGDLIYGIGFHKSRFVKWIETQLNLF